MKTKKYKISDVLEWQSQKEIDPLKINELTVEGNFSYPFYGQSTTNNGIISFLTLTTDVLNNKFGKPTILIHSNNQNIVYLESPFYLKDGHGATSVLQSSSLNQKNALYIIACIKKVITKKFAYNEKATKIALKNTYIELPITTQNEIDYNFMESYICKLESEYINRISNYLALNGLENCVLEHLENKAYRMYQNSHITYKNFKLGIGDDRLFDIESPKKKFNANIIKFSGKYPYVARGSLNNGIRGYTTQDETYLNPANTISFGQDTATIFYQEQPYFTGDKIKIMKYLDRELTPEIACYIITIMRNAFKNFAWGESSFNEKILKNIEIPLPIDIYGNIDYDFITNFIKAHQKKIVSNIIK